MDLAGSPVGNLLTEVGSLRSPFYECLGPVKRENTPTGIIRVEPVSKAGLGAGTLVGKWQRIVPLRINVEKALTVLAGLLFDAGKGITFRLGLHRSNGFTLGKKEGISFTGFQHGFADGNTKTGREVYLGAILNNPT